MVKNYLKKLKIKNHAMVKNPFIKGEIGYKILGFRYQIFTTNSAQNKYTKQKINFLIYVNR